MRVTRQVPLVEQNCVPIPEHQSSPYSFMWVLCCSILTLLCSVLSTLLSCCLVVLLSLLCFVLVPLLLIIVLFVLRFTSFDYPFGIFLILLMKLLMNSERTCVHGCLNLCSLQSEIIPNKKHVSGQKITINKAKSQFSGKKRNKCTFHWIWHLTTD